MTGLGGGSTVAVLSLAEELTLAKEFESFVSLLEDALYQRKEVHCIFILEWRMSGCTCGCGL